MTRRSILVPIVAGFSITLLILLAVIAASVSQIERVGSETTSIVVERSRKADLATQMQNLHRQRYQALVLASYLDDPFSRDEQLQTFARLAADFIGLRERFLGHPLDEREHALWQAIRASVQEAGAQIPAVIELLDDGQLTTARQLMSQHLAPLQERVMADWEALARLQREKNDAAIADAAKAEHRIRRIAILLGVSALLIGAAIAGFAIRSSRRLEQDDHATADQLQGILTALPEGILQCTAGGELLYLNPAAERLLGRRDPRPTSLESALMLVDRTSRKALTAGLWDELRRGLNISLPAGACLISADGMEFDVEGQGTPILDAAGRVKGAVLTLRDVTEAREALRHQVGTVELDPVCGLPLEPVLVERLERNLLSKRAVDRELAYLHIELDGIAQLAIDAGQSVATQFLRQAAQAMFSRIRDSDTLCRVGEHAFGLLLPACPREVSERIQRTLEESVAAIAFDWQGRPYRLSTRIGAVHAPPFAGAYDECQTQAIEAARQQGR